jgi:hypothetical protein
MSKGFPGVRLRLCFLIVALACCSCSGSRPRLYPVQGTVFFEGKPTDKAIVFLHPLEGSAPKDLRPHGTVGPDGVFRIGTYRSDDGAAAGAYAVTVIWKKASASGDNEEGSLLPARYMSPQTSQLRVEIREGPNELPPFQLKR